MSENGEIDLWRDTWVRYLGYANEVAEAFRPLVSIRTVYLGYGVAVAYTLADTADKSYKMYKKDARVKSVLIETGDALIWQTLASVAIPGFIINRICTVSNLTLARYTKVSLMTRSWFAVCMGLISIPIIVHPIDNGTTSLMDNTYRKWFKVTVPVEHNIK